MKPKRGRPPGNTERLALNVRVVKGTLAKVQKAADREALSVPMWIRKQIEDALAREG